MLRTLLYLWAASTSNFPFYRTTTLHCGHHNELPIENESEQLVDYFFTKNGVNLHGMDIRFNTTEDVDLDFLYMCKYHQKSKEWIRTLESPRQSLLYKLQFLRHHNILRKENDVQGMNISISGLLDDWEWRF